MNTATFNTGRGRAAAVLLATLGFAAAANAEPSGAGWRVRPEFRLTGITSRLEVDGRSEGYDMAAATLEFTIRSPQRPYWGGPFVDYRTSSDARFDDQRNLGVYFRYNWPRWDATGRLFVNRSPGESKTWLYASRLRYRVAGDHKIGVEAMAPLDDPGSPMLLAGYYGTVSEALSVKLLGGTQVNGAVDFTVRLELAWNVY